VIRLAVRCRPELAEQILAELVQLAPGGVEEERGADYVEYAIYGAEGELPALGRLEAVTGDGVIEISSDRVPEDWADRWRDFHEPLLVGDRLLVRPSWEQARDGTADVVIDPANAFGTGAHPTTRLCLELLLELERSEGAQGPLADWGTGSGVLAIAAARLGWGPVFACDHEESAIEAAASNARVNGVEVDLMRVNLRAETAPPAPVVTANITAPVLMAVAERLEVPPRRLICSGLLGPEVDEVAAAFAHHGLLERDGRTDGDWNALLLALA
jgi:ribosomal protein L11 methyltransferase